MMKLFIYYHVHLIIETSDLTVSEIMKRVNSLCTRNFNIKINFNFIGYDSQIPGGFFIITTKNILLTSEKLKKIVY